MARAAKKQNKLTPEEKLAQALVPEAEWPYQVPENWCWVKLGALAIEIADGPFGSNLKKDHYTNNREARIIQLSNIGEDGWKEENTKYTTFTHAKEISRSIVEPGSIVIAKMMPAGRAIICPNNEAMYVLSSDAVKFVPAKPLNTKFLALAINAPSFRNQIQENTRGITRARTSIGKLREGNLALPPLAEQQRIVDCIESLFAKLDEAKEKAQAVVDSFEDRKAAILHKAFSGEITEEWREKNNTALKSWITESIKESCTIGSGGTPSRKNADYYHGDIPWVKTGEIDWNDLYDTEEHISQAAIDNSSAKVFPEESILVAMYGMGITRGRAAILKVQAATNQAVCVLQPKKHLLNRYLYYYFMCNYKDIRAQAVGGNQLNLSGTIISKLVINIPTIPEQLEIIRVLDILLKKEREAKEVAEEIIVQIDSIKKSILVRAFRGELGTNDPDDESAVELLKNIIL